MLVLKDTVDMNNAIVIFVPKNRGRRLSFDPKKVDQKDYPKWKAMGFTIFRCSECGTDRCSGDCIKDPKYPMEGIETKLEELETELEVTDATSATIPATEEIVIDPAIFTTEPLVVETELEVKLVVAEGAEVLNPSEAPLKIKINEVVDFYTLSWNELRSYASKLFDIQGMKKAEIISKLESK